ncbi:GPI transamidase component PIG-T [Globomyces pollinis-pini]|nr:GPI transamidase component PIG-T [Globomyces pollinis-pini]
MNILLILIQIRLLLAKESLKLSIQNDAKIITTFDFNLIIDSLNNHSIKIPYHFSNILSNFNLNHLHLSFTQGRWAIDRYGYHKKMNPSGALLYASLPNKNIDQVWKSLSHALAGLFCASLNFMDAPLVATPSLAFSMLASQNHSLRYSSLPFEAVCTENLTPWGKLLPCQTKAGLATLLDAHRLFDGNYQSMALKFTRSCLDDLCLKHSFLLDLSFTAILDPVRVLGSTDWTLKSLFKNELQNVCPFADESTLTIDVPSNLDIAVSNDIGELPFTIVDGVRRVSLDLLTHSYPLDVSVKWIDAKPSYINPKLAPLRSHRHLGGSGQERGSLHVHFYNDYPHEVNITYFESIPWILKLYLHTFTISTTYSDTQTEVNKNVNQTKMNEFLFTPAIDRVRPTVMEFQLTLPPHTTTSLSIDYECAFIKVSEHHPDANHGFEIGTGVVQFNDTIFYTESLLIRLPTPDFSMPYNVITLTCTVLSLFFGSIFNMLTRRFLPIVNKSYVAKVDTDDEEDDDEEEDEKEVDDEVELKKRK